MQNILSAYVQINILIKGSSILNSQLPTDISIPAYGLGMLYNLDPQRLPIAPLYNQLKTLIENPTMITLQGKLKIKTKNLELPFTLVAKLRIQP